jgi:hypothetical protein
VHEKTTVATLRLVDTSRGWRIASLGNPLS